MDWASMITWIWYSIHSSAQSHFHNIRIYAEERNIFVVLSFYLLMVIFNDSIQWWEEYWKKHTQVKC